MCSIPGLPTPGSQVTVIISRANLSPSCGLLELWVQMDDGRKQSYDQMKEEIQIPGRKFQSSEGKPEDLCLVLISDTWHRARIKSLQDEIYGVFLIDQGKAHNATCQDLAWAHPDSFVLPPEVESCVLANVFFVESNWPQKATKFLLSLAGMKFTGHVQHVLLPDRITLLDIPVVSMHMCKLGVTKTILKEEEFKCLALKWQHLTKAESSQSQSLPQEENLNGCKQLDKQDEYFSPQLSTGTYEVVIVTEITDELDVFCKLQIFSKEGKILSKRIFQEYEGSTHCNEEIPKTVGVPCATKGSDGKWHRSLLKQDISASSSAVKVLHVDNGKMEIVPVLDIRPLYGKFLRMPVFTYLCSLAGVTGLSKECTADDRAILKSLLLNQKVVARFDQQSVLQDGYDVMLYAPNGSCINECLMKKRDLTTHLNSKSANALNQPVLSLFLNSLKNQTYLDLQTKVSSCPEERKMEHEIKSLALDICTKKSTECLDPPMHNGNPSTEVQNACNDDGLPVGSRVAVKISCIESSERFWCQKLNSNDLLENLKQDLQTYYASAQSQTFAESFYVVRNPDDNMWYRAQIIVNSHSPVIDVRFIDCGKAQKVHLHDVHPIDPTFLRLCPQAFQCCLFNMTNPPNPSVAFPDAASTDSQKFVCSITSSENELDCFVKAVGIDEQGQRLHMVDIKTKSDHVDKHLAEKFVSSEGNVQDPPQVPCDGYIFSSHNIEVGMEEKMWVTFSETVNHFYCHLNRGCGLIDRVMEDLGQHLGKPQCSDQPLGLNSVCIAKYTDDKWYRGQITELYPKVKVQFVDFGETHIVNKKDVCHFPLQASIARSTPVLAVPLGLSNMTADVPEEINQWFADQAIGQEFTMSVVAIVEKGKFIVDLFSATGHVNEIVRQKVVQMKKRTVTSLQQQNEEPLSTVFELPSVQEEEASPKTDNAPKTMQSNPVQKSDAMLPSHELIMNFRMENNVNDHEPEQLKLNVIHKDKESLASQQSFHNGLKEQQHFHSTGPNLYKWPNVSQNKMEESFASTISGPQYFWCQNSNTEKLITMSEFTQVAGKAAKDAAFEFLEVGCACLALFADDNQWYRAQVIKKGAETLSVLFVDYGNESEVDSKNVKAIPESLLVITPHALLCCLNGFVESKGSWDDEVYDAFYHLLIDKPFKLFILSVKEHPEIRVPQYLVEIECEGSVVNTAMLKYWKPASENDPTEHLQKDDLPRCGQTELSLAHFGFSKEWLTTAKFKEPEIFKIKTYMVHASCISEPNFFWCQFADTDELCKVSELAQEAGNTLKVKMTPEALVTGSPCLALFSSDNKWYRAQVIGSSEDLFNILFIDYGNECDVDIESLKMLPQSLLDIPPQAFLCHLNRFEESKGSWNDDVYDEFYNLIVDKSLKVTVHSIGNHPGVGVPQYAVEIECEGVFVNTLMQRYWKGHEPNKVLTESLKL
uniref:Tudor domain-containing protein 6-like n=2 Tax=Gouania willdenowi TaxID=441366 RepID=A0A8C5E6U2_GOUWI